MDRRFDVPIGRADSAENVAADARGRKPGRIPADGVASGPECRIVGAMKTAAILGASADPTKFGHKAVLAYALRGHTVWPVNPKETSVAGHPAFPDVESLPGRPDVVSVYLPPKVLLGMLPRIAQRGCDELWLNPGTDSPEVVEEAGRLGLPVVRACSIVGLGLSPSRL